VAGDLAGEENVLSAHRRMAAALSPAPLARRQSTPSVPELVSADVRAGPFPSPRSARLAGFHWLDSPQSQTEKQWPTAHTISVGGRQSQSSASASEVHWRRDVHLDAALVDDVPHHAAAVAGGAA